MRKYGCMARADWLHCDSVLFTPCLKKLCQCYFFVKHLKHCETFIGHLLAILAMTTFIVNIYWPILITFSMQHQDET